jgi:replication fork clamp-binding protein CrfC
VIPANQDLSTSEALKITQEIDPRGNRSLGCLTKIDIMDRGTNARQILLNEDIPLRYGYVGIKNRSQQDINDNIPVAKSLE